MGIPMVPRAGLLRSLQAPAPAGIYCRYTELARASFRLLHGGHRIVLRFLHDSARWVQISVDRYHVPYDRIIALSHHEFDIRVLIEQKGIEIFDKFANYGVVSEFCVLRVPDEGRDRRPPMVASLGINYSDFFR